MFLSKNVLLNETVEAALYSYINMSIDINENAGQRQIADVIENMMVESVVKIGGKEPKSVRTIEDVSFDDVLIDIKTRDINRDFSMPNLISIKRLKKTPNPIYYCFVDYYIDENYPLVHIENVHIRNIESIDWSALKIQNLGLGQLQLVDDSLPLYNNSVKDWYDDLDKYAIEFFEKQIIKFEKMKKNWVCQ